MSSPEKEIARHVREKELRNGLVAAVWVWVFTGIIGALFSQEWMLTDLGFWLVGFPYGLSLLAIPIIVYVQKNRQHPLG